MDIQLNSGFSKQAFDNLSKANGLIVKRSYKEALQHLLLPAREGIPEALTNMGTMRFKGLGLSKDVSKALHWFRVAAKNGCRTAYYNLSLCYRSGYGVSADIKYAASLLIIAAQKGLPSAQYQLGKFCHEGRGMERNEIKAVFWLKKSADQGHSLAQFALGEMYFDKEFAQDIHQDLIKAHLYTSLSEHNGHPIAAQRLESIELLMTQSQKAIARRLFNRWGKNFPQGYGYSCHNEIGVLKIDDWPVKEPEPDRPTV